MNEYWQKRPFLFPNVFKKSDIKVRRNQVFELASSALFDSRLIRERGEFHPWELYEGPFEMKDLKNFRDLSHWTLLVQNTEWELDSMHNLLDHFRFIPNWRLDDLQLSFSTEYGSVGPHADSYDVFLVQISGEKNWKIELDPVAEDRAMIEDIEIQVLEEFHPKKEYMMKPGDVLYLPPKIPHWGVAPEESITASVGFKVPEGRILRDAFPLMADRFEWTPGVYDDLSELDVADPGRVSDGPLDWFQNEMRLLAEDRNHLERIFCIAITEPLRDRWPPGCYPPPSCNQIRQELEKGISLLRLTPACMVYRELGDGIQVYALGTETWFRSDLKPFARLLTGSEVLNNESLKPYFENQEVMNFLQTLIKIGALLGSEGI